MKIERKYKPELIASKDSYRATIQQCYLDDKDGEMVVVATNGRVLVCLPVEAEGSEKGLVPSDALKFARSKALKGETFMILTLTDKVEFQNGWSMPRPVESEELKFPNWKGVIPDIKPNIRIGVSAQYLMDLAKAFGNEQIILEIQDEMTPMVVRPNEVSEAFGVVMPLRTI